MFKLKNKEGNAYRNVNSEVKKDALLKDGWVLVEEDANKGKTAAKTTGKESTSDDTLTAEAPAAEEITAVEEDETPSATADDEEESPLSPDGDIPPLGKGGEDSAEGEGEEEEDVDPAEDPAEAPAKTPVKKASKGKSKSGKDAVKE